MKIVLTVGSSGPCPQPSIIPASWSRHTLNHLSLGSGPTRVVGVERPVLGVSRPGYPLSTSPLKAALLRHTPLGVSVCKVTAGGPEHSVLGPTGGRETH